MEDVVKIVMALFFGYKLPKYISYKNLFLTSKKGEYEQIFRS